MLTGDYLALTRHKVEEREAHEEQMRELRRQHQERERVRQQREAQLRRGFENREPLPNLRETPIEVDDCPICFETLGQVSKTIFKKLDILSQITTILMNPKRRYKSIINV